MGVGSYTLFSWGRALPGATTGVAGIYVTDVKDRACVCLTSVLRIGVDKDHRTKNWELILYQTCTTVEMN